MTWGKVALRRSGFALRAKRVWVKRLNFFFCISMRSEHFESIETNFFFSKVFMNFVLRAKRVMGQRDNFFFFCISEYFESIETHFFFQKFL